MRLPKISFAVLVFAIAALVVVPDNVQAQDQEVPGQDAQPPTFEELITAIETTDEQAMALADADVQEVQLVDIDQMKRDLDDDQKQQLRDAKEEADTTALHSALAEQEAVTHSLHEQDVEVDDVVAADVRENQVVLFYAADDRY